MWQIWGFSRLPLKETDPPCVFSFTNLVDEEDTFVGFDGTPGHSFLFHSLLVSEF